MLHDPRNSKSTFPNWLWIAMVLSLLASPVLTQGQEGPYFGQKPPGKTPTLFAPGIVSLPDSLEMRIVFSPKGDECFFGQSSEGGKYPWKLYYMTRVDNVWTAPALASFHPEKGTFTGQPFFSADGNQLYFTSNANGNADIWVSERTPQGWGAAQILPAPVNSPASDVYYSQTRDGAAYWASDREGTKGNLDIWRARSVSGGPLQVEHLGDTLNTSRYDFDPCLDPEGRYLVFVSSGGLSVSTSDGKGGWTTPVSMDVFVPGINDAMADSPSFSPDGRYFFWRSRNDMVGDLYWIDNPLPPINSTPPPRRGGF
jgi:Tol biopolymer transport system component